MAVKLSERTKAEMAAGERESAKWRNEATLERWVREGLIASFDIPKSPIKLWNVNGEVIEFPAYGNSVPDEVIARLTLAIAHHYGPDAVNQNTKQRPGRTLYGRGKLKPWNI